MNTREEIDQEIKRLQEMRNSLPEKWEPKDGDWVVWNNTVNHHTRLSTPRYEAAKSKGSLFDTNAEAEEAIKETDFYTRLRALARELNGDWKPDWTELSQSKWRIYYNHNTEDYNTCFVYHLHDLSGIYFSKEAAKKALEIIKRGEV